MASFFQLPTSGDPVVRVCSPADAADRESQRQIYCNKVLAPEDRLRTPLQLFTLVFGAVCLGFPVLYFVAGQLVAVGKRWSQRSKTKRRIPPSLPGSKSKGSKSRSLTSLPSTSTTEAKLLSSVQHLHFLNDGDDTIAILSDGLGSDTEHPSHHAYIVPLRSLGQSPAVTTGAPRLGPVNAQDKPVVLGSVELKHVTRATVPNWVTYLTKLTKDDFTASGVVLQIAPRESEDEDSEALVGLLDLLFRLQDVDIPVLVSVQHDFAEAQLQHVDLSLVAGLIVENACILPSGERRDFFRSYPLRRLMARVLGERGNRPWFFVGFHDRWTVRPSPAVIVRGEKLARHFEGVLAHGEVGGGDLGGGMMGKSVSGFEVLRKPETTDLQKAWGEQRKGVYVGGGNGKVREGEVVGLDLEEVRGVIPQVEELLSPVEVNREWVESEVTELDQHRLSLLSVGSGVTEQNLPTSLVGFWDATSTGEEVSVLGCVPLNVDATAEHYEAILATQEHLRELEMLEQVDEVVINKIVEQLKVFQPSSAEPYLVNALYEGLKQQKVVVYKGLATGFNIPDNAAEFWGVSSDFLVEGEEKVGVRLYISRRCPWDVTTILHTWFAHHGLTRIERFEEELRLEKALDATSTVEAPLSIRTAIQGSTPAEALSLLQRIRTSKVEHPFKQPIQDDCRVLLLDETSIASWNDAHSRKYQEGTITMEQLLQNRLSHFARLGATKLPSLGNLLTLHTLIENLVDQCLFTGDIEPLNTINSALTSAYDPLNCLHDSKYVDPNAEFVILLFLCALRKSALEDVYIEATDHCPVFSQPDQAAVFSELWVLGSQCELYFGMPPRALGRIIYARHREFLAANPPPPLTKEQKGLMTVYAKPEPSTGIRKIDPEGPARQGFNFYKAVQGMRRATSEFGALSIFCLPAMLDIVLLTFLGRGLFMTAYMGEKYLSAACYALLISLLLSAGVTGWVGSVGNYYLYNYAYNNMVFFHVQRLAGGFALTLLVGVVGTVIHIVKVGVAPAFTFFAYIVLISTYLNVLGIMATMHQHGTPLTSGRTVLWRTLPLLFISPIMSTYLNGHDLKIYLSVGYGFLILLFIQYRSLCHEWINWLDNVPKFTEKDILTWYTTRLEKQNSGTQSSSTSSVSDSLSENADDFKKLALQTFRETIQEGSTNFGHLKNTVLTPDPLIRRVVKGMPYILWLMKKDATEDNQPAEMFSVAWFSQLSQALKRQQQMAQGLKEHSIFMLFRYGKLDIGQNVGLFLICLMDRWVSIAMAANSAPIDTFIDFTSRYAICFAILYFCASVMTLDSMLREYWKVKYDLSEERLAGLGEAEGVSGDWERKRRKLYFSALFRLVRRLMLIMGTGTMLVWVLVDNATMIQLYYIYLLGYSGVIVFQFNRCFTTDPSSHLAAILVSAIFGFITGCMLHAVFHGNELFFTDAIALNVASLTAAATTSIWAVYDFGRPKFKDGQGGVDEADTLVQPRLGAPPAMSEKTHWRDLPGTPIFTQATAGLPERVFAFLRSSLDQPSVNFDKAPWARQLLETTVQLWQDKQIQVNMCSRSAFIEGGFEDAVSICKQVGEIYYIDVSGLGEMDLGNESWELLAAQIIAEATLHHIARASLGLTADQAIQAEHIVFGTDSLSKRIELQLAGEDYTGLLIVKETTQRMLMKHLCFGIEIDSEWELLPPAVRAAMFQRMMGAQLAPSNELLEWLNQRGLDISSVNFQVELCNLILSKTEEILGTRTPPNYGNDILAGPGSGKSRQSTPFFARIINLPITLAKWAGIISGGGSHLERELWYNLRHYPWMRTPLMYFLTLIWRGCRWVKNGITSLLLIYRHAALVNISRLAKKGVSRTLVKDRITAELRRKVVTGFASRPGENSMTLEVFEGALKTKPGDEHKPLATAIYDNASRLITRRDIFKSGDTVTTYTYGDNTKSRYPSCKVVSDNKHTKQCFYDKKGRVIHGTMAYDGVEYSFQYFYKSSPKGNHEILKAEFKSAQTANSDSMAVFWGTPLREDLSEKLNWVPSDRVCRVVRTVAGKKYVTTSDYQHRRDPVMMTVLEEGDTKAAVAKPPVVFQHEELFLQRPNDHFFENDDLLIHHRVDHVRRMARFCGHNLSWISLLNPAAWLYRRQKTIYRPVPTWWLRTELWDHWRKSGVLDAIAACWMDELILREEPLLKKYWSARNAGQLDKAKAALDNAIEQIVSAIEIEKDVSEVCLLPIKYSDLYAMGLGRDANQLTMRPDDCFRDTRDRISVIFNDIGCWPDSPGGVSNCRRDLVNGHSTIRNHVLAESANEYGIPRFQVEKSVQSLKMLPLWGLDGRTPNHGVIDNLLESEVDAKIAVTDTYRDIAGTFVPLIKLFVKGARSRHIPKQDMIQYSNAMLGIFEFFEHKDYNKAWKSKEVASAWVEAWLTEYNDENIVDPSSYFEIEKPSMTDFRATLEIFCSYFFIFSVQTPEDCPKVFQSTHHGISSLFGMLLKYKRGATFGIWDHAILWRECCLNISPAQSTLPLPVQSMLLSGIGLAMKLAYFHADVVLPCTPVFNPIWEQDLGTDGNRLSHKKTFARKIDPIVNGVSNMDAFKPVEQVGTDTPTVVMLSNVQFIKDIKTAILAADVIVNKYGFTDYKLLVYGARDREPGYDIDMSRLIESCGLTNHVILKGFGKPDQALKDAWLFMNSSLSEGLPLAIAEAALAGVPIVATAVGATALVLTNPDDPSVRYGEVVPPNDPTALARAQIAMLAMSGPWAKFAGDVDRRGSVPPHLLMPDNLTATDVKWLTKRMYDKSEDRRKLGLLGRQMVLRGFHGKRYLREHEQMYWIQWHLAGMRKDRSLFDARRVGWKGELWLEKGGRRNGLVENNDLGGGGLQRKKSARWQEFTSGRTPYRGKRLSKAPSKRKEEGNMMQGVVTVEEVV
ncbi:family 4 putative glycosyltransferase [Triangularia verruculosa]|uniref:Family 4 putative glycosyltransferase n=1 Tax=Triangularia verruculosa TaxID=2587418 RepID=A0AAN7ATN6_9PEZI|nr:family 4 putative glycosyltransferase [Triangularia verruculosa]